MSYRLAFAFTCALSLLACSDNIELPHGGGSSGGSTPNGGSGGEQAGGNGPGVCATAADCAANAVCEDDHCVENKPCAAHLDCGAGAFCDGGTCAHNQPGGPCDESSNCLPGESCENGVCGCGGEVYGAENVPPNVLVVLDRSSSMNEQITGGTKWDVARAAINQLLTSYGAQVRFGLKLYPGIDLAGDPGPSCGPGLVFVDPADGTATAISDTLTMANTSVGTPTAEALESLIGYQPLLDPTRNNYVLLITDGQSNCADPVPVVGDLFAQTPSVRTFVVGFGSGVDPTELNDMATAGGTAQPMMPFYFQADDAAALGSAFATIVGSVLSCNYALSEIPPDPNELYVWIDGVLVPADATNGWVYDPVTNQITFVGTVCDDLQAGTAMELVVSYGCPSPPVPQ